MTSNEPRRAHREALIDLLRIVAAAAVWAYHWLYLGPGNGRLPWTVTAAPISCYGYLGVEIFFMISGLVIAHSASKRQRGAFAVARARRLYPAFLACLAMTLIARWAMGASLGPLAILANATIVPHAFGAPYADDVYWSLMFEVLFYAYVAAFVISDNFDKRLRIALWVWLALALVNRAIHVPGLSTLLILDWAPYFATGAALYLFGSTGRGADRALFAVAAAVAAAIAYAQAAAVGAGAIRPLPLISAAIVLTGAVSLPWLRRAEVGSPLARMCIVAGALSYPLYLLQNEFGGALARAAYARQSWMTVVAAAGVVVIAYGVTRFETLVRRATTRPPVSVRSAPPR